ncbi:spore coat protein [Virgibacillus sp. NKC19-3]|uniref:spore coat protein n=1 Tax=Virgibacillus saliphilus TaxID=2831674 RepID=UPI001C9A9D70|nr:spore coat protein [Virgibacillus sp. NKC19-3]MBY7142772.1 spore coat protein [Virgibacillus sp. NKC19-3]
MRHRHGPHCGCPKKIVHPTKHNCVNQYSESVVQHVHPSHTTVMNHHTVKNKHVYPHSTSMQNTCNSVDEYGGSFQVPQDPGNQVGGAMSPGHGSGDGKCNCNHGNHNHHGHHGGHHGMNHWKR